MKRFGQYQVIYENNKWRVFRAVGGNQVLVKDCVNDVNHTFARYSHKPAIFAEHGTPYAWLPNNIKNRVVKALGVTNTLTAAQTISCAY